MDEGILSATEDTLDRIYCDGYEFYMADGSRFRRTDVEPVTIDSTRPEYGSRLFACPRIGVKRKRSGSPPRTDDVMITDNEYGSLDLHICSDEVANVERFVVCNRCETWCLLSDAQKGVLAAVQERVDSDRLEDRRFTCVIIEGPGGCGKTRLMSHVMNHKQINALVLYVTKQNKRVQDFIHSDCLGGEKDPSVQKPIDLTSKTPLEILSLIQHKNTVGRFALTAEKLAYANSGLRPNSFGTDATVSSVCLETEGVDTNTRGVGDTSKVGRNIVILLDEYTMLQPPLIHALVHHVREKTRSPLLLLMCGDRFQCGPVGWGETAATCSVVANDERYFTNDVRSEILAKMKYAPLDLKMENLQRCRGDPVLGACIKRLRRVCDDERSRSTKRLVNLLLARYSLEAGVNLYHKETTGNGTSVIRRIVPAEEDALDFDGSGLLLATEQNDKRTPCDSLSFEERMSLVDLEELDERGCEFSVSLEQPTSPAYDLSPMVEHFTELFVKLAVVSWASSRKPREMWPDIIAESVVSLRHLFPVFIVLTNTSCNLIAETFLLALSAKVREQVLSTTVPASLVGKIPLLETWTGHLEYTLRRLIRCLGIDVEDAIQRQTLFVGMVYKMTSTFNSDAACSLCNGETVVLTSIEFHDNSLDRAEAVLLRKLDRDTDTDFKLCSGHNGNRMTNAKKMGVMPFVPYVSESIYQMQGNTMPRTAKTYVDLQHARCNSVYVAISRFQNSASIEGIVISS